MLLFEEALKPVLQGNKQGAVQSLDDTCFDQRLSPCGRPHMNNYSITHLYEFFSVHETALPLRISWLYTMASAQNIVDILERLIAIWTLQTLSEATAFRTFQLLQTGNGTEV